MLYNNTRNFIILVFCLIYVNHICAQKWRFGAHVGMTHAKMLWPEKPNEIGSFLAFKFPETEFRTSVGAGISVDYTLNSKWYMPIQLDYYNRRFAVGTENGVFYTFNGTGNWIALQTDLLEYQLNQVGLSVGIGHTFNKFLALEVHPYIHTSLTQQKIKIENIIDWRVDKDFQQSFDFGLAGYIRGNFNNIYLKLGYQYGLSEIEAYTVNFADGSFLGTFNIRNTMILGLVGYKF